MGQTEDMLDASHVLTIEEISNLAQDGGKPAETLMNVVALIARRFRTDVCCVYLLEPDRINLVLAATLGLRPQCIGTLRMATHEGLVGLVAEQLRPVAVEEVKNHPRFKYFSEAGEDAYRSFLGVPLIDQGLLQGVLTVQTKVPRVYHEEEIRMLAEAAAQVAPVVSEARTRRSLHCSLPGAALVAGAQSLVELGPRLRQSVSGPRSGALAAVQSQSHFRACRPSAGGD